MNILVVGNGFDLAHKLPTSYNCCLDFLRAVQFGDNMSKPDSPYFLNRDEGDCQWIAVMENIHSALRPFIRERGQGIAPEIHKLLLDCITDNFWLEYFLQRQDTYRSYQKNWIDLEQEISRVICFIQNVVEEARKQSPAPDCLSKKTFTMSPDRQGEYFHVLYTWLQNTQKDLTEETLKRFIDLLYVELEKFSTCIEIYLSLCQKILQESKSFRLPDIEQINGIDRVLSFNYTDTFMQYMQSPCSPDNICHVHGRLRSNITDIHSPLVLGVDEHLNNDEKDAKVEFATEILSLYI